MILNKRHEIMHVFVKIPWKSFTFREVKKLAGKTSDSYVYNSLKKFMNDGLLRCDRIGNVVLYSLNLASLKSRTYAGFVSEHIAWGAKNIPHADMEKISRLIPTEFYIFIITGSYVNKTNRKESDLDIIIICDDLQDPKKIHAEMIQECKLNIPPIHLHIFRKNEFIEMLLNNEFNYGKEIAKNNLILSGGKEYYGIINEAVKNGFDGKTVY